MIMCTYIHNTIFNACSLYLDLSIHMYLLDFEFFADLLFPF